jgi:protein gp37
VRRIRTQCRAAKVPFFFKQWGGVRKAENGRTLDGRTYDEFPRIKVNPLPRTTDRTRVLQELAIA